MSVAVVFAGLAAMAGLALDITVLKGVSADFVTVKFVTAPGFSLSGIILFLISLSMEGRKDAARVVVAAAGYVLNEPLMYCTVAAFTAMALHTASLFRVCGAALILLSRTPPDGEGHEH